MRRAGLGFLPIAGGLIAAALTASAARHAPPRRPAAVFPQERRGANLDEVLNPRHTALIVHEMLNDWISVGGADDKRGRRYDPARVARIIPPIQQLIAQARAKNVRVVYMRYTSHADGTANNNANRFGPPPPNDLAPGVVDGTWGWENIEEVKPQAGDWILRKYRPDSFFQTPLDALLRWNGIRTFVLVGIGGNVGIVPTLMTGRDLGYVTVAATDCIISRDAARMDDTMKSVTDNALTVNHQQVLDAWSRQSPAPAVGTASEGVTSAGRQSAAPSSPAAGPVRRNPNLGTIIDPAHTVLLVHEMTNDSHAPGGADDTRGTRYPPEEDAKAIPRLQKVIAVARANHVRVVYARYTSHADGTSTNHSGIEYMVGRGGAGPFRAVDNTWGWAQIDEVKPEPGEWIIRKYRPDAFFATTLDALLGWNGVKTVVLIGSGGTVGVIPTLRSGRNLGYATVAVGDCILARDPTRMPEAMKFIADTALVTNSPDVVETWNRK